MDDQTAEEPKRRERSDARENRRLLLTVAKQRFAEQGVAGTTMQEIARIAGVGQGTIYRHFAHKGELCLALIQNDVAEFQARLRTLIGDGADEVSALRRLEILIAERVTLMERHLPLFAAMDEAGTNPRRGDRFRGPFDTWVHEQVVRLLTEATAQHEVMELDIRVMAELILAAMSAALYRYQRTTCGYSQERIVAALRRLCVDGLRHQGHLPA
jgi:AcrR family transcriptional regulator